MSWKDKVAGGFGAADARFAIHPAEEERAKDAIKQAKAAGASLEDFQKEALWHCYQMVKPQDLFFDHVNEQLKKMKHLWG